MRKVRLLTVAAVAIVVLGFGFATEQLAVAGGRAPEAAAAAISRVFDWPTGVTAWTIVLATSATEAKASVVARTARNDGLPQAGYIRTGTGSRPWIVFSGVLAHAATKAAERRARGVGFAHARVAFVHKNGTVSYS